MIHTIAKLRCQVRRNVQRVPTILGGGQLCYLALMIDAALYNTIPGAVIFVHPQDPSVFTPTQPVGVRVVVPLTAGEIAAQNITFDKQKQNYNECQGVHKGSTQ